MIMKHGGPAFPIPGAGARDEEWRQGMSLRDWFAGQALAVIPGDIADPEDLARDAYRIAAAMLDERKKWGAS